MATDEEVAALRVYVGATTGDDAYLASCWDSSVQLNDKFIGTKEVPVEITTRCYTEVAAELFHRRSAPNGITQFADASGNPVRVARDPMVAAYRLLMPYVGLGIG